MCIFYKVHVLKKISCKHHKVVALVISNPSDLATSWQTLANAISQNQKEAWLVTTI